MTTEQKTQHIIKKCIEVNPEIVELKHGCEFKSLSTPGVIFRIPENGYPGSHEIIGRPITLEDVLMAMKKLGRRFVIAPDGHFVEIHNHTMIMNRAQWTLGKPLTSQSEETISFLYDLLK